LPLKISLTIEIELSPETRITAIAPTPEGVANAQIASC